MDEKDLMEGWSRTRSGGYNTGAMFVCELVGVCVNSTQADTVVPGIIGTRVSNGSQQIGAHETCLTCVAVLFDEELLNECLGDAMEEYRGYPPAQHESMRAVKAFLEDGGSHPSSDTMVLLQKKLVGTPSANPNTKKKPKAVTSMSVATSVPPYMPGAPCHAGSSSHSWAWQRQKTHQYTLHQQATM